MTRKTSVAYMAVFKFIEEKLFKLQPAEFMTDYEDGMRLAIRKRWGTVVIRGCWFHYCRAIWKKTRKLGMTKVLKQNSNAKVVLKSLMALALLPADRIEEGFRVIKTFANRKRLSQKLQKLFIYFEGYWLNSQVCLYFR